MNENNNLGINNVNNQYVNQNQNNFNQTQFTNIQNDNHKSKSNKKFMLIILGILIIVGAILLFFYLKKDTDTKNNEINLSSIYDPNKPILIEKNDKFGYISSEGKEIVKPQYKTATEFYDNYAIVSYEDKTKYNYELELYQVIDKKGNAIELGEMFSKPEYIPEYNVWIINNELYNEKFQKVFDKELYIDYIESGYFEFSNYDTNQSGIIDYKGNVIFSWDKEFISVDLSGYNSSSIDLIENKNKYARVYSYEECEYVINIETGDILYKLEDPVNNYLYELGEGIFEVISRETYTTTKFLYFYDNKLAYENSEVSSLEVYDYESIWKTKAYDYYDVINNKMLEEKPTYDIEDLEIDINETLYGYKEYSCNYKEGLLKDDSIIIPCEYDNVKFLNINLYKYLQKEYNKEIVLLEKDNQTIIYDLKNKEEITTFNANYVTDNYNSTFLEVALYDDSYNKIGTIIYNLLTNKSMTLKGSETLTINSNYITLKENDQTIYYNTKLEQIYVEN